MHNYSFDTQQYTSFIFPYSIDDEDDDEWLEDEYEDYDDEDDESFQLADEEDADISDADF